MELKELQAQLREVNAQVADARTQEKRAWLATVKEQVQALGISQDELLRAAGFLKDRKHAAAKYYDPSSGKSWSGKGPRPKWLDGKNLDAYLIDRTHKAWWPGEDGQ
ncbi:H-NS histone family protein [Burkholderia lata]|uniref:Histone-like nucleoid-structuring protein H-NS n=1 Tax=Burkholderia lata (strain ATCC 17760 / DSM 23089 / LMG 22485 / NCIMB 9086 / R18194 / 383) TaxID=482957 RepID=A0A6P2GRF1_BURL3|nr:H-NS histone family protein [Burkholderia lata]VWB06726.1 histone-like nucleoid-structuring protein H-NS [Burkholderia lata]